MIPVFPVWLKDSETVADALLVHAKPTHAPTQLDAARAPAVTDVAASAIRWGKSVTLVLAATLIMALWVTLRRFVSDDAARYLVASFAAAIPPLLAGMVAWRLRARDDIGERAVAGWKLFSVGCLSAAASNVFAVAPNGFDMNGSVWTLASAGFHYLGVTFLLLGLTRWVRRLTPAATLGAILDLGAVGLLSYLAVWNTTLRSIVVNKTAGASALDHANLLAYPVSDVLLLVAAVAVLSQIGRYELRGAEVLATFGIVAFLASDLRVAFLASDNGDVVRSFVSVVTSHDSLQLADAGFYLGFLGIALGAAIRSRRATSDEHHVPLIERSTTWEIVWTLVPFAMLATAMVVWEDVARTTLLNRVVFFVLVGLLITRGGLVALHNLRRARTGDTDPLTGAYNHSYLQECITSLAVRAERDHEPLSLLMIDVDDFALLNESYSHSEGDRLLREMAYVLRTTIGDHHVLFRPGGDEFAVAMPATDSARARELALDIERALGQITVAGGAAPSLTMGIATLPDHTRDAHELIGLADGTLYWGKLNGKRSVTVYDPETVKVLTADERVRVIEQNSRLRAVLALARALDARDAYTARHSQNVARYAVAIAFELGWDPEQQELLRIAGLLHDVGKIGVRDSTLQKTASLSEDERAEMRSHPILSAQVISGVAPEEIIPWVIAHHERWDGRGYPHGNARDTIPLGARILAVADSFDAMTSSRSYRSGLPVDWVIGEIGRCAGEQFDPDVVRAFLHALTNGLIVVDPAHAAPYDTRNLERVAESVDSFEAEVGSVAIEPEFSLLIEPVSITPEDDDAPDQLAWPEAA